MVRPPTLPQNELAASALCIHLLGIGTYQVKEGGREGAPLVHIQDTQRLVGTRRYITEAHESCLGYALQPDAQHLFQPTWIRVKGQPYCNMPLACGSASTAGVC